MTLQDFFSKICSRYLWGNIFAIILLGITLIFGALFAISIYTHHGESITVPSLKGLSYESAEKLLSKKGLNIMINDSGFVRTVAAGSILEQSIQAGTKVKEGRTIYITINSTSTPTLVIPDIADNSSIREAQTKLRAIGFKLGSVEYIKGEKDWVYEVKCGGNIVSTGSRVSIDSPITLVVGNGEYDTSEEDSSAMNYPADTELNLTEDESFYGNE